ncbi:MAG: hypothetical protein KAS72_00335 [Phycisphaerales bacterium]|nr:hypothetical protein [Phycisphaerales bacterium]
MTRVGAAEVQLICEVIPRRDATTTQLQDLGRALERWKDAVLPGLGLRGELVRGSLDDLLSGELPTPAGILIANCARSLLQQRNVDAAIRAYLMQLASRNWDAVNLDAEALARRTVCGVITLSSGDQQEVPTPEQLHDAFASLRTALPASVVSSVKLKRLVSDTTDSLRDAAEEWSSDEDDG